MKNEKEVYWGKIIQNSFYYEEYIAYEITKIDQGVILTYWDKSIHYEDFSTGSPDRIFFKYQWLLPFINTIRSIPEKELSRGTDDSGYGEWERRTDIDSEKSNSGIIINNNYYERSSPKIEVFIYSDTCENLRNILFPYATWENDRLNHIYLPHESGFEGYVNTVEPILMELEKYVPQEDKKNILPPLGKIKSDLELAEESYKKWIKEYPEDKKKARLKWIRKQRDNDSYDVTALVFFNRKLEYQKTLSLSIKQMAMIKKTVDLWMEGNKKYPFVKKESDFQIEITDDSKYENFLNIKTTINGKEKDSFEIPMWLDSNQNPFYFMICFTDAEKVRV